MIITTQKPERQDALDAIKQAVIAGAYDWPAGEEFHALTNQLAAHLHTAISNNEFEAIVEAYNDYVGRLDWNQEEIMRYLNEPRWQPWLEDAAWDKALQVLTETTNVVLLAMHHDILDDAATSDLYNGETTETTTLRSAA